ncbi:MAG: 1-deoxy-D-xylulose-5-phosphate reductoisomerase [Treponemataceae bacterium]|nr:1-deoxy-D-xylulose-5-phosphate reductoisomerase [Treponemataceae bacterium]
MKDILVLGATGSIGKSTLDLARRHKEKFRVVGLQAHSQKEKLDSLAAEFQCRATLSSLEGDGGIAKLLDAAKPQIVVNGIAGSAGLIPSRMVLERGIDLALANKESVVMAWNLVNEAARKSGAKIIPVDSEHSAIFNLASFCGREKIAEIILTASGGPFRNFSEEQLANATLADALKHPTWNMGKKITVDSATLANKGLEVIEACRLFDMPSERVDVVVHPESLIHSLVRTTDGILYAQISEPDMRHPIMGALCFPEYMDNGLEKFSLAGHNMSFMQPRRKEFPLLDAAYSAVKKGPLYTIAFNAADEVAANAFIEGKINFLQIARVVQKTLEKDWSGNLSDWDDVFQCDKAARAAAEEML